MLSSCSIVAAILKMATGRNFTMSGINSGHHNLLTYEMSLKSNHVEFVRYCGGHSEIGDRRRVEIFQCRESIRDIIIYPHIKFWWYLTMLNFCDIVVAILKMATGRNFSMSGNQFGTSLSTHISNFDDIGQCWIFTAHSWCRVLAAILKMADILKILKTQNCSADGDLSLCQNLYLYH